MTLVAIAAAIAFIALCEHSPRFSQIFSPFIEEITGRSNIYATLPPDTVEVHVIDVGQADSTVIRCPEGVILIDAGTSASEYKLEAHLDCLNIKTIDYLICTHPHDDHIGGADMIVREYSVTNLLICNENYNTMAGDSLKLSADKKGLTAYAPEPGEVFTLGDVSFTVLGPIAHSDNLNNMSIVIMLEYGDTSFLFTGDAEKASEDAILEMFDEEVLDCDFYKVGHHGGASSSTETFLSVITPEIAVISCGKDNEYAHPNEQVLKRLSDVGCDKVFRTDQQGTVVIRSDGRDLTVYSQKG